MLWHLEKAAKYLDGRAEADEVRQVERQVRALVPDTSCYTCANMAGDWHCLEHLERIPFPYREKGCDKYESKPETPF